MPDLVAQIAPILTALALVVTAIGGLSIRRRGLEAELRARAEKAEGQSHTRLTLLRRIELWLIENKVFDEKRVFHDGESLQFPPRLRDAIDEETDL